MLPVRRGFIIGEQNRTFCLCRGRFRDTYILTIYNSTFSGPFLLLQLGHLLLKRGDVGVDPLYGSLQSLCPSQ